MAQRIPKLRAGDDFCRLRRYQGRACYPRRYPKSLESPKTCTVLTSLFFWTRIGIRTLGRLSREDFYAMVASSRAMVGNGLPVLSPSPFDVSHGTSSIIHSSDVYPYSVLVPWICRPCALGCHLSTRTTRLGRKHLIPKDGIVSIPESSKTAHFST